jgi:hypothetical protein
MLQNQGIPASAAGVYTNGQAPAGKAVKDINGRKLSRRLKRGLISPTFRALLARDLETGAVRLHNLTRRQACRIMQVSVGYVTTVARTDPENRKKLEVGQVSLAALHTTPTDRQLDRLNARVGADRVMAALDRYTRPQFKFAAE